MFRNWMQFIIFSLILLVLFFCDPAVSVGDSEKDIGSKSLSLKSLTPKIRELTPAGWKLYDDEVLHFTPDNLYEQINGRAEYFLAFDMVSMAYATFEGGDNVNQYLNVSIYDMGIPRNAFGVFSGERSKEASPVPLGREAYRSQANYYIWQGQYYIQIIASDATKELRNISRKIAGKIVEFLPDSGESVWGLSKLPKSGLVPNSVQFFLVDAMGLDFMHNTYTAQYHFGVLQGQDDKSALDENQKKNSVYTVFLSRCNSQESAQERISKYRDFFDRYGKETQVIQVDGVEILSCNVGGKYDLVFQKKNLVAGITSIENRNEGVHTALNFWKKLGSV